MRKERKVSVTQYTNHNVRVAAFTLVEMLIIVPIVMLVVSSMVVAITVLSTDALQVRTRTETTYEMQNALDTLEKSVVKTMKFPAAITGLTNGQGSNNLTASFTSLSGTSNDVLLLALPATDKNPLDSTRIMLYATGTGLNTCASGNASTNPVYPVTYAYFVSNGTLYERTIVTNDQGYDTKTTTCTGTTTTPVWQRGSCAENVTGTECVTTDVELMNNVSAFTIAYVNSDGSTAAGPSSATGVQVTLTSTQNIAGQSISITLSMNAQSQNI